MRETIGAFRRSAIAAAPYERKEDASTLALPPEFNTTVESRESSLGMARDRCRS